METRSAKSMETRTVWFVYLHRHVKCEGPLLTASSTLGLYPERDVVLKHSIFNKEHLLSYFKDEKGKNYLPMVWPTPYKTCFAQFTSNPEDSKHEVNCNFAETL